MKSLFVHIGMHKTGTTAIQHFLSSNKANLERLGYLYPGNAIAQHEIGWMLKGKGGNLDKISLETGKIFDEIRSSVCEHTILSSETLSRGRENTAARLKPLFDSELGSSWKTKIIIYLRRQDHWLESRYMENIKTDFALDSKKLKTYTFSEFLRHYREFYEIDYSLKLAPWRDFFGAENIFVRVYEKEQLAGNITSDFLSAVGISQDNNLAPPARQYVNTGLSPDAIEVIRLYNKYANLGPVFRGILRNTIFTRVSSKKPFSPYSYFSGKERFLLLKEYEGSNRKVAKEYLGREDGRLFYEQCPDPSEDDSGYKGITVERIFGR